MAMRLTTMVSHSDGDDGYGDGIDDDAVGDGDNTDGGDDDDDNGFVMATKVVAIVMTILGWGLAGLIVVLGRPQHFRKPA